MIWYVNLFLFSGPDYFDEQKLKGNYDAIIVEGTFKAMFFPNLISVFYVILWNDKWIFWDNLMVDGYHELLFLTLAD